MDWASWNATSALSNNTLVMVTIGVWIMLHPCKPFEYMCAICNLYNAAFILLGDSDTSNLQLGKSIYSHWNSVIQTLELGKRCVKITLWKKSCDIFAIVAIACYNFLKDIFPNSESLGYTDKMKISIIKLTLFSQCLEMWCQPISYLPTLKYLMNAT